MSNYEDFKANDTHVPLRDKDGNAYMAEIPSWWKGSCEDVEDTIRLVKKGTVEVLCKTPGGRNVTLITYGNKNNLKRTANYSSAMGGEDFRCYADKTGDDYLPTVCIIGAEHGGEFEGVVAINNLIKNIETGTDYAGKENAELIKSLEGINLLLIPCVNMDGRARIPLRTMAGQDYESFRYYSQGTWKDGSLCEHPACKKVHPLKDKCSFLGGYFNDDGVNIVHDNFFFPMAEETKALLHLADDWVPDISLHLHGGGDQQQFYQFDYMPRGVKERIAALADSIEEESKKRGLDYLFYNRKVEGSEDIYKKCPPSFNIQSAWTAICGEPAIIFETCQGLYLNKETGPWWVDNFTFEDVYGGHMMLFESTFKFVKSLYQK